MAKPTSVAEYLAALSNERKAPMAQLMACIRANLPGGFEEILNYGMPSWVVPRSA